MRTALAALALAAALASPAQAGFFDDIGDILRDLPDIAPCERVLGDIACRPPVPDCWGVDEPVVGSPLSPELIEQINQAVPADAQAIVEHIVL